mmetsp:Transcript_112491/g.223554  ORF Transcript_112491/g.223554 Transcript_112491/m.223554 type:complete len:211 (-) Transcript_112491:65-697(-)
MSPNMPYVGGNFIDSGQCSKAHSSVHEIADETQRLQQRIDENAEVERSNTRCIAQQKHVEIQREAAMLKHHAMQSIQTYKEAQLKAAAQEEAFHKEAIRQQAERTKQLIDQQAAQMISEIEVRDQRIERQTQGDWVQVPAPMAHGNPRDFTVSASSLSPGTMELRRLPMESFAMSDGRCHGPWNHAPGMAWQNAVHPRLSSNCLNRPAVR